MFEMDKKILKHIIDAYAVPGIRDEHECTTPEDLKEITCYEK